MIFGIIIILQEVIDEHKATLDRDNSRDLIDSYLIEMEEKQNDTNSTMNGQYVLVLFIYFVTALVS